MSRTVNALLPCGTPTARRRHLALAEICPECEPDIEWSTRCPHCRERVTVFGDRIGVHDSEAGALECWGSKTLALPPKRLPRPLKRAAVVAA